MIQDLEKLVRDGQFTKAKLLIKELRISEIPRSQSLAYANIASRLGLLHVALRVLNPVIRGPNAHEATAEEKLQYANCLRKLGAVEEAMAIIIEIQSAHPEALLHLAFCLQSQWRYKEAIPILEKAVAEKGLEPYRQLVAKVNLLAAFVNEKLSDQAVALANELVKALENSPSRLLYANVLELSAQIEIHRGNFSEAFIRLEKAKTLLSEAQGSTSTIFIEKWMAIGHSLQQKKVVPELMTIHQKALEQGHWETVRDCEFYRASLTGDRSTLIKLYFGTPHAEFRERILQTGLDIPETWDYADGLKPKRILDLRTGVMSSGDFHVEPGQASHRLLIALSQDLYRPLPLLALFSRLFPGEYFNPDSSPNRVHQILKRYRKIDIGIAVEEADESYRLNLGPEVAIRLPKESFSLGTEELRFLKLRSQVKPGSFTLEDAISALEVSRSSAQRVLKWGTENHKLTVSVQGGKKIFKMAG